MRKLAIFILLILHETGEVQGFCKEFPFGHICRNMDLTGFCMQVSHMLRIRRNEKPVRPYLNFEKLFDKLESVGADEPFVHFGGYKRPVQYHGQTCLVWDSCVPSEGEETTPSSLATTLAPNATGSKPCAQHKCDGKNEVTNPPFPCPEGCKCCMQPPDDLVAKGTIFSLQDGCELRYLKAPIARKFGSEPAPQTVPQNNSLPPPPPNAGSSDWLYEIPVSGIPAAPPNSPTPPLPTPKAKKNPYHLEVTEISINKVRLHNWLHIKIHHKEEENTLRDEADSTDFGKGKIKAAFVMVHDEQGFPVGEFVNNIECFKTCHCSLSSGCYQAKPIDTFPCMFDSRRVILNTGMMIVISPEDGKGSGFNEIHGTWRYSQSRSPEHFHMELHFHALIVDTFTEFVMFPNASLYHGRISAISERRIPKKGVFGWNPIYTILHPTNETVGAYDYYREGSFSKFEIDCHTEISDAHYVKEPYPDSGDDIKPTINAEDKNLGQEHCYRLNNSFTPDTVAPLDAWSGCYPSGEQHSRWPIQCPGGALIEQWFHDSYGFMFENKRDRKQVYPWTMFGARTEAYVIRESSLNPKNWQYYDPQDERLPSYSDNTKLYFGIEPIHEENSLDFEECAGRGLERYGDAHKFYYPTRKEQYEITLYGHTCHSDGRGRRVPNFEEDNPDKWPNALAHIFKLPAVNGKSYWEDRCYCPKLPPTPNPRFKEPPEVQIQGRRQHAYQMIIAWNCFVPFSIFVSRYFKETYSKVLFLQEYWWYTTHVLCMFSAAMFTFGGIYVMELKRRDPVNWLDPHITVHVGIGYTIICLFFFQVVTGFFRLKDVRKRIFNIFTHWLFGVIEYLMAIACMINSAFILLSGMSCAGIGVLAFLIGCQVMFYASMEVHMRNVDKMLHLKPPRSYLPPPIMRVFHKDAPDSKFRIYVLLAYLGLCVFTSTCQFISMEANLAGESCFIHSKKYEDQLKFEKLEMENMH